MTRGGVSESPPGGDTVTPEPLLTIIKPDIKDIRANGGVFHYLNEIFDIPTDNDKSLLDDVRIKNTINLQEELFGDEDYCRLMYQVKSKNPEMSLPIALQRIDQYGNYA